MTTEAAIARSGGEVFDLLAPRSIAVAICFTAVVLGVWWHSLLLYALALLMLLLLASTYVLVRLQDGTLAAGRKHPPTCFEGTRLTVELTVRGTGWLPLSYVDIESPFGASLDPTRSFLLTHPLWGGREVRWSYAVTADRPRGTYDIGPLTATISDPFGFWVRRFVIPVSSTLTVYPSTFHIRYLPMKGKSLSHHVGQRTTAQAGTSEYFFGTREYRHGDPLRFIHWPSSARRRRLVVKEFELSVATELTIFVDLERATFKGLGKASTLEQSVTLAASISDYALRGGHTVSLIGEGARRLFVPLGAGDAHFRLILEALTRAQADGDKPLRKLLSWHVPRISRESSVVIIWNSIEMDYDDYEALFEVLRSHSVKAVAVFIDDTKLVRFGRGDEPGRGLSLARIEERERMKRAGIDVYVVSPDVDPAVTFRAPWDIGARSPA